MILVVQKNKQVFAKATTILPELDSLLETFPLFNSNGYTPNLQVVNKSVPYRGGSHASLRFFTIRVDGTILLSILPGKSCLFAVNLLYASPSYKTSALAPETSNQFFRISFFSRRLNHERVFV